MMLCKEKIQKQPNGEVFALTLFPMGGPYGPPRTSCQISQNWCGPKARAFGTFILYQFCTFLEKIGKFACLDKMLEHFYRRPLEYA